MKEIKKWIIVIFTIVFKTQLPAQTEVAAPNIDSLLNLSGATFFSVSNAMESYFQTHSTNTDDEDGPFMSYLKWKKLWEGRISYGDNPTTYGHFSNPIKAFQSTINTPICDNYGPSNWKSLGPQNQSIHNNGRVDCVYADPNDPKKVYVGTLNSGLWVTNDINQQIVQWTNLTDTKRWAGLGVKDIAICPSNSSIIYLATGVKFFYTFGYGIGVIKSIDGGQTWNITSLSFPISSNYDHNTVINKILIDPNNHNHIFAISEVEVFESNDAGNTWNSLNLSQLFTSGDYLIDIEFNQINSSKVFVSGNKLWEYSNGNWQDLTTNLTANPTNSIRLSKSGTSVYAMYKSTGYRIDKYNQISWTNYSSTTQQFTNSIFEVSNDNPSIIYNESGSRLLMKSSDGGISWSSITSYDPNALYRGLYSTHADIRSFYIISGSNDGLTDNILCGSDGGILLSKTGQRIGVNDFVDWKNCNGNMALNQFWGISEQYYPNQMIIGGTQDDGVFTLKNNSNNISNFVLSSSGNCVGDAYESTLDLNSNRILQETNSSSMVTSYNNGMTWNCYGSEPQRPNWQTNNWATSFPLERGNNNNIYSGSDNLFKLLGNNWLNLSNFNSSTLNIPGCRSISAIGLSESNSNTLYLGFSSPTWNNDMAACPNICNYPNYSCSQCSPGTICLSKKLFRVENLAGTPTFVDLTSYMDILNGGTDAVRGAGISGIAVNPNDEFEFWVAFNEFWIAGGTNGYNRVIHYKSNDNGLTWIQTDYSDGLREFPVNCIKFDKSTNGLYIGTDIGVFYRKIGNPNWECFNNNLPVVIVTDLELNYCASTITISTYGRGLWQSSLYPSSQPTTIPTTTINTPINFITDLIIQNSSTVVINSTISMSAGKKIIVERGGTLIIDGGKITNSCGQMWKGIEVWGDASKSQLTNGAQGKIIMKNGATIENAIIGISNTRILPTTVAPAFSGGIIQAKDSKFINCGQSVNMMLYHNFHPININPINDISYFNNCEFLINSNLNDPSITPDKIVSLYDIVGVKFSGCEFRNITPVKGIGIWGVDSKFTVDDLCLSQVFPCNTFKQNEFDGFKYGIYASNSNPFYAARVNHAIFTNCSKDGGHLAGMNYATVNNCDFEINGTSGAIASGLYLDNCKYYSVQNNNFHSTVTSSSVGIYVKDSKIGAHELYRNKFTNLNVGIMPLQDNSGITNFTDGLTMHCNEFITNSYDIAISSPSTSNLSSIAWIQGIPTTPPTSTSLVRNIYSAQCIGTATENKYYINNITYTGKNIIHGTNSESFTKPLPQPSCSDLKVSIIASSLSLDFNSHCQDKTALPKASIDAKIMALSTKLNDKKTEFISLIDGGNTNNLLNVINSNMSPGSIKNILLSHSPFLSDLVLEKYISKADLPPYGHIKQVIIANSPVSETILEKINTLNLPDGIYQQINSAQTGISARQLKEAEITQISYEKELTISDKIRYFINDTLEQNPIDSIVAILKQNPRSENSCEEVGAYIAKGDFIKAQNIVDSLQAINKLDEFCSFQKTIIQLNQSLEKCYKLKIDNVLKNDIEAKADDCSKDGCCNAQALLKQVFNYEYDELRLLPEESRSAILFEGQNNSNPANNFNMYPNPTDKIVNFIFNDSNYEVAYLSVFDMTGRLIDSITLKNGLNYSYDTSPLENSIYLISLSINNVRVDNRKLVLTK